MSAHPDGPAAEIVYGIDDRPAEAIPLGFQHLVAMLLENITPPLPIAGGRGLAGVELRPEVLAALAESLRAFLGSGLITGGLTALSLNLVLPEKTSW